MGAPLSHNTTKKLFPPPKKNSHHQKKMMAHQKAVPGTKDKWWLSVLPSKDLIYHQIDLLHWFYLIFSLFWLSFGMFLTLLCWLCFTLLFSLFWGYICAFFVCFLVFNVRFFWGIFMLFFWLFLLFYFRIFGSFFCRFSTLLFSLFGVVFWSFF